MMNSEESQNFEKDAKQQKTTNFEFTRNDENNSLILEIILMCPHLLSPAILLSTALVSKECNFLSNRAWPLLDYRISGPLDNYFVGGNWKYEKLLNKFRIKRKYGLDDEDISKIRYWKRTPESILKFYSKRATVTFALIKYGGPAGFLEDKKRVRYEVYKEHTLLEKPMYFKKRFDIVERRICKKFGTSNLFELHLMDPVFFTKVILPFLTKAKGGVNKLKFDAIKWKRVLERIHNINPACKYLNSRAYDFVGETCHKIVFCNEDECDWFDRFTLAFTMKAKALKKEYEARILQKKLNWDVNFKASLLKVD